MISLIQALNATRFALHASTPTTVLSSTARISPHDPRIDAALHTHLIIEDPQNNPTNSKVYTDMSRPWTLGILPRIWDVPTIEVETEKATIVFYNFLHPHLYHCISVTDKESGVTKYHKQYDRGPLWNRVVVSTGDVGGKAGWSSFRWMLEAFVDAVQGRTPAFWVAGQESIWLMESVDLVYRGARLPVRKSKIEEAD